jgi:alkanesulfonate monooxygenase SsuD/methylene tetrahydromethanopterin reductase-like flavin-dependent oxidoreductase (luciferase family)
LRLGLVINLTPDEDDLAADPLAPVSGATLLRRARDIEEAGFDGVWVAGEGIGRHNLSPDPLSVLSVAAAGTRRVELGVSVFQVPLRPAVELTRRVLTVHALSEGRFTFGVGAGSTRTDFDTVGADYEHRFRTLEQSLDLMSRLWDGDSVSGIDIKPWPSARGGPRIVIGAWHSSRWLRRAAQRYDGWIGSAGHSTFAGLREAIQRFRDFGGQRAILTSIRVDLAAAEAPLAKDARFDLACGPRSARERLARLADLGFDDVVIGSQTSSIEELQLLRSLVDPDDRAPVTAQPSRASLQHEKA